MPVVKPPNPTSLSCYNKKEESNSLKNRELRIALAGNANVGKSVIFNQLTGLNQVTGNWPGKTVERAEGTLFFENQNIRIIDLPGTYSLSAYSMEEIVTREYIAIEKPDAIINPIGFLRRSMNAWDLWRVLEHVYQISVVF